MKWDRASKRLKQAARPFSPPAENYFCPKYPATAARPNYDTISIPLFPRDRGNWEYGQGRPTSPQISELAVMSITAGA
jgi:hypothetical protein